MWIDGEECEMIALLKIWSWIKNYWYIPLLAIASLVAFLVFRRPSGLKGALQASRESHKRQSEVIERIDEEKREKKKGIQERHEETMRQIEQDFAERKEELSKSKRKKAKKIIKETDGDNDALARKVVEEFGVRLDL